MDIENKNERNTTLTEEEVREHDLSMGDGTPYQEYFKNINNKQSEEMNDFIEKLDKEIDESEEPKGDK